MTSSTALTAFAARDEMDRLMEDQRHWSATGEYGTRAATVDWALGQFEATAYFLALPVEHFEDEATYAAALDWALSEMPHRAWRISENDDAEAGLDGLEWTHFLAVDQTPAELVAEGLLVTEACGHRLYQVGGGRGGHYICVVDTDSQQHVQYSWIFRHLPGPVENWRAEWDDAQPGQPYVHVRRTSPPSAEDGE